MAKFLTTVGNSFYIEQIIINSKKNLTLVTPYLQLSKNLIERIADADKRGTQITFIYGKNKLSNIELKKLSNLDNIQIYFFKDLHAKCYHNENSMIISSMNLYEFSERNNREMGILVEKHIDQEIFSQALDEIESIKNASILENGLNRKELEAPLAIKANPKTNSHGLNHMAGLYFNLKNKYSNKEVLYNKNGKKITIRDFISGKFDIEVHWFVLSLYFDDKDYKRIKGLYSSFLEYHFPNKRIYWNNDRIKIYPPKDHEEDFSSTEGIEKEIKELESIIDTIHNKMKLVM